MKKITPPTRRTNGGMGLTNFSHKTKMQLSIAGIIILTLMTVCITLLINNYITARDFQFRSPIVLQAPVVVTEKKTILISPLPKEKNATPSAKKKPITLVEQAFGQVKEYPVEQKTLEQVETRQYIEEVFGPDADTALLLLSHENFHLRRDAVNTAGNIPVGSRDIGVFQINEFWQKVQGKFLFNWKTNIEIAHDIYVENGDFNVWTWGRKLGI